MKQAKFSAFLVAAAMVSALGFTSCSNDDDEAAPMTKTQMLTRAEWKGADIKVAGISVKDDASYKELFGDVSKFRATFNTNMNFTMIADEDTMSGKWMLMENDSKLMLIDSDQDTTINTISVLTNDSFVLADSFLTAPFTIHYKH